MKLFTIASACLLYVCSVNAVITYTLAKNGNPSADEADAYRRIDGAMQAAIARWTRIFPGVSKNLRVQYAPWVETADATYNGDMRFGANRGFMTERTALHEISHTLGVGTTRAYNDRCNNGANWPLTNQLLRSYGNRAPDDRIACYGIHIGPYGLNFDSEGGEFNMERHVFTIEAMIRDGMQAY
jgi:hypothetical protein